MFCPKCGGAVKDGAGFCPKCGAKVQGGDPQARIGLNPLGKPAGKPFAWQGAGRRLFCWQPFCCWCP
ncbi:MAG: zinc-ribbon domain-containing protein [Lachnospiraceae bacterium]|nr:zinc-ribbon domain-containing protein [Lachnospiraceae bacterium]